MKSHKSEKKAYPDHQPEHDSEHYKHHYNSFQTTQRNAYVHESVNPSSDVSRFTEREPTGSILDRGAEFLSQSDNCLPIYPQNL